MLRALPLYYLFVSLMRKLSELGFDNIAREVIASPDIFFRSAA